MINVLLLLGTVLAVLVGFALFSGLVFGVVNAVFTMVLLWFGRDTEGTLQSVRRQKTAFRNSQSRRAGIEYHLKVSYCGEGSKRYTKLFTSKNWDAFHDIEAGRIIPVRVWKRVSGWAALCVDLPSWKNWMFLVLIGSILSLLYMWVLGKLFQFLLGLLVAEGLDEQVSKSYIIGGCLVIVPAYIATTLMELTKTEVANQDSTDREPSTTVRRTKRSLFRWLADMARETLSRIVRNLETERYVHHPKHTEMTAMLSSRGRESHEFV